jgi:glutamyl-tRNA synthetase
VLGASAAELAIDFTVWEHARLSATSDTGSKPVVTRFAPSPTGFLHIGGARTALFNLLFARHHGGKFLLRIEDTDRARSTEPAIAAILDGMRWLGLDWDGDEIYQFSRAARHAEVAHAMLANGHAYKCFATAEELEAMRAEQRANKQPLRYDGRWRDRDASEAPEGAPFVVRLKAPREGSVTIQDRVQGAVTVNNSELDDMVLLRSDGTPTYMLAVVVDDHDMGVTHIIRGDDHLNNAFRQLPIYRAMNAMGGLGRADLRAHPADPIPTAPRCRSVKARGVDEYRDDLGLLPEAVSNYLLRLGWGHGDDEIISREQAIEWFDSAGVGKSPRASISRSSRTSTAIISALRRCPPRRTGGQAAAVRNHRIAIDTARSGMPSLKPRAANLNEIAEGAMFLFRTRPLELDEGAAALLEGDAPALLFRSTYRA